MMSRGPPGERMRRSRSAAVGAAALLLSACAAPSSDAPRPLPGGSSESVNAGPDLAAPVFDVRCMPPRSLTGAPAADLPSLRLACLGPGRPVDTATLVGGPTVVNFWASWCDPCRREMPMLASVAHDIGDAVRFVGVNTKDDPDVAADLLESTGVRFEQLYDPDGELLRRLGTVQGLPVTLVLDADGAVTLTHIGQIDEDTLVDTLEPLP